MITLKAFLNAVQENVARIHAYELGHDGSDGKSDCIGLIIGALALCGFKWPGVHGSNWTARNAMTTLDHIADARNLFLGEIVFKAREPGESGYDLPNDYASSPDQRDYYHVGVVTNVSPLEITHCTNVDGGIKQDSSLGAWHYGGRLKYVEYNNGEDAPEPEQSPLYQAIVTAPTGNTVNLRKGPGMNYTVLEQVPIGNTVDVLDVNMDGLGGNGWNKVQHGKTIGYMMRQFLRDADSEPSDSAAIPTDKISALTRIRVQLLDLAHQLEEIEGGMMQ
jgi:uncharacterized protein YraI